MDRAKFIEGMDSDICLADAEREDILNTSIFINGSKIKCVVAMEEFAELQQQISKYLREEGDYYAMLEEMADACLCLDNLKRIFGITDDEIWKAIDVKLLREKERLKGAGNDIFKQALEEHNLTVGQFLDLRDAWDRLGWRVRSEMLKEEENKR